MGLPARSLCKATLFYTIRHFSRFFARGAALPRKNIAKRTWEVFENYETGEQTAFRDQEVAPSGKRTRTYLAL
jgi:hypothetical protein